eukprot:PhF_6_TR36190/c2_g1_i1/m.52760
METFAFSPELEDAALKFAQDTRPENQARYTSHEYYEVHMHVLRNCRDDAVCMRSAWSLVTMVLDSPVSVLPTKSKLEVIEFARTVALLRLGEISRATVSVILRLMLCVTLAQWRYLPQLNPDIPRQQFLQNIIGYVVTQFPTPIVLHFLCDTVKEINAAVMGQASPIFSQSRLCAAHFRMAVHRCCLTDIYPAIWETAMESLSTTDELLYSLAIDILNGCCELDPPLVILHPDSLNDDDCEGNELTALYTKWEPLIQQAHTICWQRVESSPTVTNICSVLSLMNGLCNPSSRAHNSFVLQIATDMLARMSWVYDYLEHNSANVNDVCPLLCDVLDAISSHFSLRMIFDANFGGGMQVLTWLRRTLEMSTYVTTQQIGTEAHLCVLSFWSSIFALYSATENSVLSQLVNYSSEELLRCTVEVLVSSQHDVFDNDLSIEDMSNMMNILGPIMEQFALGMWVVTKLGIDKAAQLHDDLALARCVVATFGLVNVLQIDTEEHASIAAECFQTIHELTSNVTLDIMQGSSLAAKIHVRETDKDSGTYASVSVGLVGSILYFWEKSKDCFMCVHPPRLKTALEQLDVPLPKLFSNAIHFVISLLQEIEVGSLISLFAVRTMEMMLGIVEISHLSQCGDFLQQAVMNRGLAHVEMTPTAAQVRRIFHRTFLNIFSRLENISDEMAVSMVRTLCEKIFHGHEDDVIPDLLGVVEGCCRGDVRVEIAQIFLDHFPPTIKPQLWLIKFCSVLVSSDEYRCLKFEHFSPLPYRLCKAVCDKVAWVISECEFSQRLAILTSRCLQSMITGRYVNIGNMTRVYNDYCLSDLCCLLLHVLSTKIPIEDIVTNEKLCKTVLGLFESYFVVLGSHAVALSPPEFVRLSFIFIQELSKFMPFPFPSCEEIVYQIYHHIADHHERWVRAHPWLGDVIGTIFESLLHVVVSLSSNGSTSRSRRGYSSINALYEIASCIPQQEVERFFTDAFETYQGAWSTVQLENLTTISLLLTNPNLKTEKMEVVRNLQSKVR